jgi:hypothetical protein
MNPILSSDELTYAGSLLKTNGPEDFYTYLSDRGFNYAKLITSMEATRGR